MIHLGTSYVTMAGRLTRHDSSSSPISSCQSMYIDVGLLSVHGTRETTDDKP